MPKKPNDFGQMATKKHNQNAEGINNLTRELQGVEEGPKEEIQTHLLKTTRKNIKQEIPRP